LPVLGQRHADIKNGLSVPPTLKIKNLLNMATRPGWVYSVLSGKRWTFGNLAGHVKGTEGVKSLAQWVDSQFDETLNWKDVEWIRTIWPGKLIIKGILDVEDAKLAVQAGASAIVVSNHGGRQLDGVAPTLRVLPEVVAAVNGQTEVLLDGGIRRGSDIVKALCLGARAVLVGRAYAYGLAAGGGAGVTRAIEILRTDLVRTLKLLGCASAGELDRSFVDLPGDWLPASPSRPSSVSRTVQTGR